VASAVHVTDTCAQHQPRDLAFTRYCCYQYCMVYGMQTGGRKGNLILSNNCAIVSHQGGQCKWARGTIGCLIRAQKPRSELISCQGRLATRLLHLVLLETSGRVNRIYIYIYINLSKYGATRKVSLRQPSRYQMYGTGHKRFLTR